MPPSETVRVVVRCRPLNSKERQNGNQKVVEMDTTRGTVVLQPANSQPSEVPKTFTFDQVYDDTTKQENLYAQTASRIVDSVLEGFNGTIFAYGQTGTGKTFTMEGVNEPPELRGIIPRAFHQIFDAIATRGGSDTEFLVRASYLEIYNEDIRDLLNKNVSNRLELKENPDSGVYVKDLTSYVVKSTKECDKLRDFGARNRHTGATAMNAESSRSHSIYTITVESCEQRPDGSSSIRMGKLNLVDLAGSERQSKTQASGERLKEATKINLSLSALGNVHLGAGRRQVAAHPVPRLEADAAAAGLARREHQDGDGRQPRPRRLQLRRDALDAALRQPREEHQEQTEDQRGPEGRDASGIPGRDRPPQARSSPRRAARTSRARRWARTGGCTGRTAR